MGFATTHAKSYLLTFESSVGERRFHPYGSTDGHQVSLKLTWVLLLFLEAAIAGQINEDSISCINT